MVALEIFPSADYEANEDRWEQMVSSWWFNGIITTDPTSGMGRPYGDSSGMSMKVEDFIANIRGFFSSSPDLETVPIDPSDSNPRWDRVVVHYTSGGASRTADLTVIKGTPAASNPALPPLEDDEDTFDLEIARVYVGGGVVTITAADVTDVRTFAYSKMADPIGTVKMFYGATAPVGWLGMRGQTVNRDDYPILAKFLGITASTFVVPDMTGRVPRGYSGSVGGTGGSDTATLAVNNLPAHSHTHSLTWSGGSHTHSFTGDAHSHGASQAAHSHGINDPGHRHGVGGDQGYRFVVTASSSTRLATGSTPYAANEVSWTNMDIVGTGISIQASQPSVTVNAATATGTIGASGSLSGSVSGSINNTGGGEAFSIIPAHRGFLFIIRAD